MTDRSDLNVPGVNFYSPVGVVSGLGSAGRGYLAALRAADVPVAVVPVHELFLHQPGLRGAAGRERAQTPRHAISIVHINADSVHRAWHFHGRSLARARYRIGVWVWELAAFREEWCEELRHFDEIWVPSTFCRRAVAAVTDKPVIVMPHVVAADAAAEPDWRARLGLDAGHLVFLYVFDASSMVERKNPRCLVDAFEAAFPDDARARLVLKVSHADSDKAFADYLTALAAREPRCIVLRETLGAAALAGLMRAADCYVSPHRTEGFGLTVAEAMALGLPAIATDYGGTADFVSEAVGFPLRYRLVEIARSHGPYGQGAVWSEPSREHLTELLRAVAADPPAAAARGQRARARMRDAYSAAAVGRRIRERLSAIASGRLSFPLAAG